MSKIIKFQQLHSFISKLNTKLIVLVGGVFDLLHLGHIRFLSSAKKHGVLIVALENDENVRRRKGNHRPFHSQTERAEMLINLATVDYVLLLPTFTKDSDYTHLTEIVRPVFVAITEGDPYLNQKTLQAEKVGAQIIIIPKIASPSTSQLAKLLKLE